MNKLWDKVYVINLDKRLDRFERISSHLRDLNIDFERVSAISPETIPNKPPLGLKQFLLKEDGDNSNFTHKLESTWACMYSHLVIINKAKQLGYKNILIIEDDCELEEYTLNVLSKAKYDIDKNNINFDLLYLGGRLVDGYKKIKKTSCLYKIERIRCTYGYIVNNNVFDRILSEAPKSSLPIDWYYSEILQKEANAFLINPVLAIQTNNDISDIENTLQVRKKLKFHKKLAKIYYKYKFR